MERFPRKCKLEFEIIEKPNFPITSKALSETEGRLLVSVGKDIVFDEEDILLAEFYLALTVWVSQGCLNNFKYDSMDYEDSPIFEVKVEDTFVHITSVWMDDNVSAPVKIEKQQFLDAVNSFIHQFEIELPEIKEIS
ncbi:MAG: hypothetical protein ABJV04_02815 [Aliiglaciecola sp.]|uniref:DUF7878 domain-containing protein n=1 Tax=Aliiglaciecola sp. TaxID=1872441 RepID=UPI003298D337